jgi:hypothetical protein
MSISTDLKACLILEGLIEALPGAAVDYQASDGTHHFIISRPGMTHRVVFAEQVLEDTESADLQRVLPRITRKLLSERAPCRIRVGPHGAAQRAAA